MTAITHHWCVSHTTVGKWRRALGVPRANDGTHALTSKISRSRDDDRLERARANSKRPKALRKMPQSLKGRVQLTAIGRSWSAVACRREKLGIPHYGDSASRGGRSGAQAKALSTLLAGRQSRPILCINSCICGG